ncbi:IQ and ubiquitin-like domain-containing protein [Harpegnathos saltator]|uniref:IQ and ubiquitin-like domain-containing protein n=1 Tax=Harpegnathos saltator TaxID=610380 RepID=E2BV56_HARSA|nr:IQ and ubiquitin-like domain-containing protein [Harpegnathos saltator]EFN80348.1 IQ and ubiquitin-like domain-containing protein [Harpegnathos saltator]
MEKQAIFKPYLGGWRHKVTGVEYLNATSQTGPLRKQTSRNTCSRMVQCVRTKDGTTQTLCHHATQMWRDDCYIPNQADEYMTVKSYESYAEMQLQLNLDGHARVIQRNYRAYRLRKYIKECARIYRDMLEKCEKREEEKAAINKMRHKQNILRQVNPRSREDFDILYNMIERWRSDRFEDIKSRLFKAAQRAENYRILEETVEMLNHIDKHKQAIRSSYRRRRVLRFLTLNCKPIRWIGYRGIPVEMVTVKIQKARQFKAFYEALNDRDVRSNERMRLLMMLRGTVEAHDCAEALELLSVLNQEIALLTRGIKDLSSLGCLNERITHIYLNFTSMHGICGCEAVDGNSKDHELREPLETKAKFCRSCLKVLPDRRFLPHSRTRKLSVCISCDSLSRRNIAHVDYDSYIYILDCVRADELRRCSNSALAFMMQGHDIYHLVNHIWHGQSAVSKSTDLFLLRLIRYQTYEEWAPWNCILLTEDEADMHSRIKDPAMIYSKHLIDQIGLAHQIAKNHFQQLIDFEKDFRESGRFHAIQSGKRHKLPLIVENYDAC